MSRFTKEFRDAFAFSPENLGGALGSLASVLVAFFLVCLSLAMAAAFVVVLIKAIT